MGEIDSFNKTCYQYCKDNGMEAMDTFLFVIEKKI